MNLSIIIPTRDRPQKLEMVIKQLNKNSFFFNEIIIVDSSNVKNKKKIQSFLKSLKLNIKFFNSKPSIAFQRNVGIKKFNKNNKYFMFLDDDIVFMRESFTKMKRFIKDNHKKFFGFSFNLVDTDEEDFFESLKKSKIVKNFGLYDDKIGKILQSGWHTKIKNAKENVKVEWIPSCATIFKNKNKNLLFDNFFSDYSYLEDLDYSYRMSKFGSLVVVKECKCHHKNNIERKSFNFGKKEFINRYYFVKKNKFSKTKFFFTAIVKMFLNLIGLKFSKTLGNIWGLISIFFQKF